MTDYREIINILKRTKIKFEENDSNAILVDFKFVIFQFDNKGNLVDIHAPEQA